MDKQDLEAALLELDDALARAFKGPEPMQMLIVGGACLLLQGVIERPTEDVDVIIFNMMGSEKETSLIYDAPLANKIRRIIKKVGKQRGMPHKQFLNDDCAPFLLELSENTLPAMTLFRAYRKLQLYVPSDLRYMLACKLMAGRPAKDYTDIQVLCTRLGVVNRAQAQHIVDLYFSSKAHQRYHDLSATLDTLF